MATISSASSASSNAPSNPDGVTGRLSNWIYSTNQVEKISPEILTRAKYLILDGIACAVVASHLPWSETAAKAIFNMEPEGNCSVIGWGGKRLSAIAAATLNSTFIQGFELDDYHSTAPLHSNAIILPALLSASKITFPDSSVPKPTGSSFLVAYIVGCEVGPRVGLALHGKDLLSRGWHSGAIQGPSAAAAAVASLLHLPPNQIEDALGIACTQAGGLMSAQFGSMAKRMQHGFACRNGLLGALMAQGGYTGIHEVFETPYGGYLSCFGQGAKHSPAYMPEMLVKGLGVDWEVDRIRVKLHASMAFLHGTIDCVENLQKKHPEQMTKLDEIESIVSEHGTAAYEHGGWKADASKPMTTTSAQMNIAYTAATQLVDGQVLMAQFGADKLNRPILRELMAKTTPIHNPKFEEDPSDHWRTTVTVTFKDGTKLHEDVAAPRGLDPPCTNEQIVEKWRLLVDGVLDDERRDEIEQCVLNLENVENVDILSDLLEPLVKSPIKA